MRTVHSTQPFTRLLTALALIVLSAAFIGCGDDGSKKSGAAKQIQDFIPPSTADMVLISGGQACTSLAELAQTHVNGGTNEFEYGFVEGVGPEYEGSGGVLDGALIKVTVTRHSDEANATLVFDNFYGQNAWAESPEFEYTVYAASGMFDYSILFRHGTYVIRMIITQYGSNVVDAQTKLNSFADHVLIELGE